jgi:hypothetical protein
MSLSTAKPGLLPDDSLGESAALKPVREPGPGSAEELLRAAHKAGPAIPEVWMGAVALSPAMSAQVMGWWIDAAAKVGGPAGRTGAWPEFTFDMTERMLENFADHAASARAWDKVFGMYQSRPDLALRARVELAERAEKAGDPGAALRAYEDALKRYGAAGPYAMRAIVGAQKLLQPRGAEARRAFASMLAEVWRKIERPSGSTMLFEQTMWVRVGRIYAEALVQSGDAAKSDEVKRQLESARPASSAR